MSFSRFPQEGSIIIIYIYPGTRLHTSFQFLPDEISGASLHFGVYLGNILTHHSCDEYLHAAHCLRFFTTHSEHWIELTYLTNVYFRNLADSRADPIISRALCMESNSTVRESPFSIFMSNLSRESPHPQNANMDTTSIITQLIFISHTEFNKHGLGFLF